MKWGGAAVTVLLVVVWIGSGWWSVQWTSRRYGSLGAFGGNVRVTCYDTASVRSELLGWRVEERRSPDFLSRFNFNNFRPAFGRFPGGWFAVVPLWCLLPIGLCASLITWRLDVLARRLDTVRRCPRCGYDRAGLPLLAVCPECGSGSVPS